MLMDTDNRWESSFKKNAVHSERKEYMNFIKPVRIGWLR